MGSAAGRKVIARSGILVLPRCCYSLAPEAPLVFYHRAILGVCRLLALLNNSTSPLGMALLRVPRITRCHSDGFLHLGGVCRDHDP